MAASWKGHHEVVGALLSNGKVDLNHQCNTGSTALMAASWKGHTEVIHKLLQTHKVDVNLRRYADGITALWMQVKKDMWKWSKRCLRSAQLM
jgi:ankyrin repeat protein